MSARPAYVDEHSRHLPGVPPTRAYDAARAYAERLTRTPSGVVTVVTRLLGTDPAAGFEIVTVVTLADFPGLRGAAYRTAVIGSRGHVLAVRLMLRSIASRA